MTLSARQCEALLFASGKPWTKAKLARVLSLDEVAFADMVEEVKRHLDGMGGICLLETETELALGTHPDVSDVVREELRKDVLGELSKPSVETLAIIAYRGPVTKPEIEQIRGVNCSLILRNLLIRGLIEETADARQLRYSISMEFLRHLGVAEASALPDFAELSGHALLEALARRAEPGV